MFYYEVIADLDTFDASDAPCNHEHIEELIVTHDRANLDDIADCDNLVAVANSQAGGQPDYWRVINAEIKELTMQQYLAYIGHPMTPLPLEVVPC
jgi:hypothetical protein